MRFSQCFFIYVLQVAGWGNNRSKNTFGATFETLIVKAGEIRAQFRTQKTFDEMLVMVAAEDAFIM